MNIIEWINVGYDCGGPLVVKCDSVDALVSTQITAYANVLSCGARTKTKAVRTCRNLGFTKHFATHSTLSYIHARSSELSHLSILIFMRILAPYRQELCLFCLPPCSQSLKQCLAHSRHSVHVCQ